MNSLLLFLLLVSLSTVHCHNKSQEEDSTAPPMARGKSFFLFGAIFRKFRQRWTGHHDPGGSLFAGPAFPLYGYQNCPAYGCNPALTYQPAPYEPPPYVYYHQQPISPYPPNTAYVLPPPPPAQQVPQQQQQQQQQMHQQSNVVIYHQGPNQHGYYAHSIPPPVPQPYPPMHNLPPYGANGGPNVGGGGVPQYPPPYPVPTAPAPNPSYPVGPGYAPLPPTQPGPAYGPPVGAAVGVAVGGPAPPLCNAQMYPCQAGK